MKKTAIRLLTAAIVCLMSFSACESLTDKCEKTRWKTIEDPILTVRINCRMTSFVHNNVQYKVSDASEVTYTGTITKYYCNDEKSGSFDFKRTIYPVDGKLLYDNVMAGGPYQFNFQNDLDRLRVEVKMRIQFPDGSVFRVQNELVHNFWFDNIKLDINNLEKYVLFTIYESNQLMPVK
jgi:hypothetical protein